MSNNVLINGRTAVHGESGGVLSATDICKTPSSSGCSPVTYTSIAQSSDASGTAGTVFINGQPACHAGSTFASSTGNEPGRCGGMTSGTVQGAAEFITFSPNVFIEGQPAVRDADLMISNFQNTPPVPLVQPPAAPIQGDSAQEGEEQDLEAGPAGLDVAVLSSSNRYLNASLKARDEQDDSADHEGA